MANKEIALFLFILLFVSSGVIITDYVKRKRLYGEEISENIFVPIKELYDKKDYYRDRKVKIKGRIMVLCRKTGAWFNVNDGTGLIYVDLEKGKNFVIPATVTFSPVIVEGNLREIDGRLSIIATGVRL